MAATATGVYHTSYASELRLRHTRAERLRLLMMVLALLALPWTVNTYWLGIVNTIGIAVIGAVGLNILVGFTGQISLGQGGFLAVGAFTSALLVQRAGLPLPLAMIAAVLVTGGDRAPSSACPRCASRACTWRSRRSPARRSSSSWSAAGAGSPAGRASSTSTA